MTGKRIYNRLGRMALGLGLILVLAFLFLALVFPTGAGEVRAQQETEPERLLPFQRVGHTTIYDVANNRLITFGGWNGRRVFNDVWALNPTPGAEAWTQLSPDGAPPPARTQHTAIYDAANGQMIVFGGRSRLVNRNDVWALDLTPGAEAWRQISPAGTAPVPRRMHAAVYDAANGRMVVFGGGGRGGALDDVWALDLTPAAEAWVKLTPSGTPPGARVQHTAVYDVVNGCMVVFGGAAPGALYDDTWVLNLTSGAEAWSQLSPAGTLPAARRGHAAIYDVANRRMLIFGGVGSGGFYDDTWALGLTSGAEAWSQLSPTGQGPSPRAWHSAARDAANERMIVFGGLGPGMAGAGTHWALSLGASPAWTAFTPSIPVWEEGEVVGLLQAPGGSARPTVSLTIEDARPHTVVNVVPAIGEYGVWYTRLYVVAGIRTTSSRYASDIDVTLAVEDDALGTVEVGTKTQPRDEPTNWTFPTDLGNGRYRYEDVDLARMSDGSYRIFVVFRFWLGTDIASRTVELTLDTFGQNWRGHLGDTGTARVVTDPGVLILTNRRLLFDQYGVNEGLGLLRQVYEQAQGSGYNNNPTAVVVYADRYVTAAKFWDNTQVDYTSESTANGVANAIDAWLDGYVYPEIEGGYPGNLLIVGDDNIIPFYRQHNGEDPYVLNNDPVLTDLVTHNYYFTDNPYGDTMGGTDWEEGDLEIAVGRIVGASAADMKLFLQNSVRGPDSSSGRVIIASGEDLADWHLPGGENDILYPFNQMGYEYDPDMVDGHPTKTDIVDALRHDHAVFAVAAHGSVNGVNAPGGTGPDWDEVGIIATEVPQYDVNGSISDNRIFFYFLSCRVGLSHNTQGPYGSMVYALVHHNASGGVAAAGEACCVSAEDDLSGSEQLSNDFWVVAARDAERTDPLGWALMQAKGRYNAGSTWTAGEEKIVQEFTLFGVPWIKIRAPGAAGALAASRPQGTDIAWSMPRPAVLDQTYVVTGMLDASIYAITQTAEGFDLIQVEGMDLDLDEGIPALPIGDIELSLPVSATVTSVVVTPTNEVVLSDLDIPSIEIEPKSDSSGPAYRYVATPDGTYPTEMSNLDVSMLDTYQLARVSVIPLVYDATNDQATIYRTVTVQVTYQSPVVVALSHFETDKTSYAPGETVNTTSEIVNVGDTPVTLTAALVLQDVYGWAVGLQRSGAFEVPAGGSYTLTLGWTGQLDDDAYLAKLFVRQGEQVVAGASQGIFVARGEIADLSVPEMLTPGETGTFEVTFANRGASATIAVVGLSIYDADDDLVAFLGPQTVTVEGGTSETVSFEWAATALSGGTYTASATVTAGGQIYGPASQSFKVGYRVYLPLVLRTKQ